MSLTISSAILVPGRKSLAQWLQRVRNGEEGYSSLKEQEPQICAELGEDDFTLLLEACEDKPGF